MTDKKTIVKKFQALKPSAAFKQLDFSKLPKEVRDKIKADLSQVSDGTLDLQFDSSTFKKWVETFSDLYPAAFGIQEEKKVAYDYKQVGKHYESLLKNKESSAAVKDTIAKFNLGKVEAEEMIKKYLLEEKAIVKIPDSVFEDKHESLSNKISELETRSRTVKKMILKQPKKRAELKVRLKTIDKMIAKAKIELKSTPKTEKFLFGGEVGSWTGKNVKLKNALGGYSHYLVKKKDSEGLYTLKGLNGADEAIATEKELESQFEPDSFADGGSIIEKVLWAVKKGEPDWAEEIITTNSDKFEEAKKWASENGFDRFRVAEIDMSVKPDFTKTINKLENGGELTLSDAIRSLRKATREDVKNGAILLSFKEDKPKIVYVGALMMDDICIDTKGVKYPLNELYVVDEKLLSNGGEFSKAMSNLHKKTTGEDPKATSKNKIRLPETKYVAVHEGKDGYWTISSKPTTKEIAESMLGGTPSAEFGKVVTLEEVLAHKKVIGEEYLKMKKGVDVSNTFNKKV